MYNIYKIFINFCIFIYIYYVTYLNSYILKIHIFLYIIYNCYIFMGENHFIRKEF